MAITILWVLHRYFGMRIRKLAQNEIELPINQGFYTKIENLSRNKTLRPKFSGQISYCGFATISSSTRRLAWRP